VRLHGLIDPLNVSNVARSDGTVVQTLTANAGDIIVTTISAPTGLGGGSALTGQEAAWLEKLARAYGLIDPLTVTETTRGDGTLAQTISELNGTTTVALQ
jgi:hypothetical protein